MIRLHGKGSIFLASLLSLFIFTTASAEETTSTTTTTTQTQDGGTVVKEVKTTRVVTPVPAAKEVVAAPSGYVSCFTVAEGWFNNVWVPAHQVCQYENMASGVVWVEGYWGCNQVTSEGVCSNWEWKSGRWEKKLVVY